MTLTALSRQEWRMLLRATVLVIAIRTALWVVPSRHIVHFARRVAVAQPLGRAREASVAIVVWAVHAVSRRVPGASCLTQALTVQLLLRQSGLAGELCLGVARAPDGAFRAHAWVEHEGRPVIGGGAVGGLHRLPGFSDPFLPPATTPRS